MGTPFPGKAGAEFQGVQEKETLPLGTPRYPWSGMAPGGESRSWYVPKSQGGAPGPKDAGISLVLIPEFSSWSPFLGAAPASDP